MSDADCTPGRDPRSVAASSSTIQSKMEGAASPHFYTSIKCEQICRSNDRD